MQAISKEEGGKWQPIVQKEEKREEKRERKKDNETEIVKKVEKPVKERRGPTQLKFKYYDPGDHWCKRCNVVGGSATSLLQHLQSNQHMKVCSDEYPLYTIHTIFYQYTIHVSNIPQDK